MFNSVNTTLTSQGFSDEDEWIKSNTRAKDNECRIPETRNINFFFFFWVSEAKESPRKLI